MSKFSVLTAAGLLVAAGALGFTARSAAQDGPCCDSPKASKTSNAADEALARIKGLEGEWVLQGPDGPTEQVVVRYRVTAGGSAVLETLFPGSPQEMLTVYHQDKGALVLTHYCCLGNQPRMRATPPAGAKELTFNYESCSNLSSPAAAHMHDHRFVFVSADRLQSEWTLHKDGQAAGTKRFDLRRKKAL